MLERVDWYAKMAKDEAKRVHTVPATATQKATPMSQLSPKTKGSEASLQAPLTYLEPHPAEQAIKPREKKIEVNHKWRRQSSKCRFGSTLSKSVKID